MKEFHCALYKISWLLREDLYHIDVVLYAEGTWLLADVVFLFRKLLPAKLSYPHANIQETVKQRIRRSNRVS